MEITVEIPGAEMITVLLLSDVMDFLEIIITAAGMKTLLLSDITGVLEIIMTVITEQRFTRSEGEGAIIAPVMMHL